MPHSCEKLLYHEWLRIYQSLTIIVSVDQIPRYQIVNNLYFKISHDDHKSSPNAPDIFKILDLFIYFFFQKNISILNIFPILSDPFIVMLKKLSSVNKRLWKNGTHFVHHVSNIRNVRLDRHYFIRSLSRIPLLPLLSYIFRFISPSYPRVSSSKCQLERPDNSIRGNNQQAFPLSMVLLCLCVWRYRESHGTEMDCGDECETRWPRLLSESSANIPISRSFLQRRGLKNFSTVEIKRLVSRVYYYRGLIYL